MRPSFIAEDEPHQQEAPTRGDRGLFGPYLAERQWGTIREDYSEYGACWDYFPHDHARSRTYRWGEDGLLGFSDREARLCFGLALWNGRDPILKERLFGLAAPEGNHGEDVKELYYYLDSTPTHSYFKALYKYPLGAYPYERLVREGRERNILEPEFEIEDTGAFEASHYVDVTAEYAKASPKDMAIRITLANRSGEDSFVHVIPQLWFRNTWSWGREGSPGYSAKPNLRKVDGLRVALAHDGLGPYVFEAGVASTGIEPQFMFTDNETNIERLFGAANSSPFVKDAFHEKVINGRGNAVNPRNEGTKVGVLYPLAIAAGQSVVLHLRLACQADFEASPGLGRLVETFSMRVLEADQFYEAMTPKDCTPDERNVLRQGYASLLWSKQAYNFSVAEWIQGDPAQPAPPQRRRQGRNHDWPHIVSRDVISMPDKWEYPWYAAWDLAFHMIPMARVDPSFARDQLSLFLTEGYMHPSGQLPAYEFAFGDVNPPVHAWACLRVFQMADGAEPEALTFLRKVFSPLVRNFRWWRSLESKSGGHLLRGGFLGLDNIGAFDRGAPSPLGGHLEQADGTGWMAFFSLNMLAIALELGKTQPAEYDDLATEFFDQFAATARSINRHGGEGLWHEGDGFYCDHLNLDGNRTPLRIRSMVGLIPLFAVHVLERSALEHFPKLQEKVGLFLSERPQIDVPRGGGRGPTQTGRALLAIPSRDQLARVLGYLVDEASFLGPTGVRSVSKHHQKEPYVLKAKGAEYRVEYAPDESRTQSFGANSNWRGPVWLPLNYLLVEALGRYHEFYGESLRVECPRGSGVLMNLKEAATEIERRLASTFLRDKDGRRPSHGNNPRYHTDPHFMDLVLFYEYFSGESGRGFGASHQTGWTTLALRCIEDVAKRRSTPPQ